MAKQQIYHSESTININKLEHIAMLMYQLNVLDLEKSLWMTYFKSGSGISLKSTETNLQVWPLHLKKIIQLDQDATTTTTLNDFNQIEVSDYECFKFVNKKLHELNENQYQFQQQLILKKKEFFGYTSSIENTLQTFIQEHLESLRLQYQYKIKLIEFYYNERVLEHEIQQQNPNEQQVNSYSFIFTISYTYFL